MYASLYTLGDPKTPGDIRYVGWTSKRPSRRLGVHISDARSGRHQHHCARWIRSLLAAGVRPLMTVVAVCGVEEGPVAEVDLIAALRALGHRLVNGTDGGEGTVGWVPNTETRAKLSAAHLGKKFTPEHRAKLGAAHLGKKRSPEHRATLSAALRGRKLSPEHRARISAAKLGKKLGSFSPETRAKMSAARLGKKHSPETRAKMSAAYWAKRSGK